MIAFIHACDDVTSDQQEAFKDAFCNEDRLLDLYNPQQFKYARPVRISPSVPEGIAQIGGNGKEVISGMTVDESGNTYVFGLTDNKLDGGPEVLNEMFVARTNNDGTTGWFFELPASEASMIFDATTDDEYVYAAGRTYGSLPGFQNQGRWDGVILKINKETGEVNNLRYKRRL